MTQKVIKAIEDLQEWIMEIYGVDKRNANEYLVVALTSLDVQDAMKEHLDYLSDADAL